LNQLLSISKDIGVVVVDAKPYVVNKMLTIDSNRVEDSKVGCTHKDCSSSLDPGMENNIIYTLQGDKDSSPKKENFE
jgi:hypothetical protein